MQPGAGDELLELALDLRRWVQVHQGDHARLRPAGEEVIPGPEPATAAATIDEALPTANHAVPTISSLGALGESLRDCRLCTLHEQRTQVVFGCGSHSAEIVFVGEGPGRNEDIQGEPFVGEAGMLLDRILSGVLGLQRSDVYIANVVKCRPPGNRDPLPDEVSTCSPFLWQQLDFLEPVLVVALGRFAAQTLLQTSEGIGRLRGRVHPLGDIVLLATYHPAYLLRNPGDKRKVFEDMKLVRQVFQERTGRELPQPKDRGERS
jgi:DNA polymerase